MANNLKSFEFTNKADTAISVRGWEVLEGVVINALAGNDIIKGTSSTYYGILNFGTIKTGDGKDTITGTGTGISNYGTINTGIGNDIIKGTGSGYGYGIRNYGTINTGDGDDIIKGTSDGYGINNYGTINTGDGNDRITGTGGDFYGIFSCGILNYDTINTGAGKDIVDALEGGFAGNGTTYLDAGNDTLKGFGTGNFYGGAGTDKLFFGEGTYVISGSTVVFNGATMNVNQFEKIGGANGGVFTFQDGTLTVSSTGVGTFA
jgi:hypothetical protein